MSKTFYVLMVSIIKLIHLLDCLRDDSIAFFGVERPPNGAMNPGCGINYDTNTIHVIGGLWGFNANNLNQVTWNALDTTDWGSIDNYTDIKSPSFNVTQINTDILTSIPGYKNRNGFWECYEVQCTTQINRMPYIYIVGPNIEYVGHSTDPSGTSSMLIYDMNINDYIQSTKYRYIVPGTSKIGSCVTSDGNHLYVIGGYNNGRYFSSIYRYTPPTSGNYTSNTSDDTWIFMGNMRYSLGLRGCTVDKLGRYLYMIGGEYDPYKSVSYGEYIDLNEYELNGFSDSYYFMGNIIDEEFRNNNPLGWRSPNCFASQYEYDIIYCGGGTLGDGSLGNGRQNEVWTFERFYSPDNYTNGADLITSPEIYGCSKASNYSEYFYYPKCAGFIGHNINTYLQPALRNINNIAHAPRQYDTINPSLFEPFEYGCNTPWYSVNNNISIRFYMGGTHALRHPYIIREDSDLFSFEPTSFPTVSTGIPTLNPTQAPSMKTKSPSLYPTLLSHAPTISPTSSDTPTMTPSKSTSFPTNSTYIPTLNPTYFPTLNPTETPSIQTVIPSMFPTVIPTSRNISIVNLTDTPSNTQNITASDIQNVQPINSNNLPTVLIIIFVVIVIILLLALIFIYILYKYYMHYKQSYLSNMNTSQNIQETAGNTSNNGISNVDIKITDKIDTRESSEEMYDTHDESQIEGDKSTTQLPKFHVKTKK